MHGENIDRKRGKKGRGLFGTGKSAAFAIADVLRITTVRNKKRSIVELTKKDIKNIDSGEEIPIKHVETEEPCDESNGTEVKISKIHLKSLDQRGVIQFIERNLTKWPDPNATVIVNNHECERKTPDPPLILYETGTLGSSEPQNLESVISNHCDVVLSSSLFAMRLGRMPLWDSNLKEINFEADLDLPITKWDKEYNQKQPKDASNRAYQNRAFVCGLEHLGLREFHHRLFHISASPFSNAEWWVITLGDAGMVALRRSDDGNFFRWYPVPQISKVLSALGCGDVSRAGFLASFMKGNEDRSTFLSNTASIEKAVKTAVAAGTMKAQYFTLKAALQEMFWEKVLDFAIEVETHDLHEKTKFRKFLANMAKE